MKKFKFISFLFLTIMSLGILCSCGNSEGQVGPVGPQGEKGETGEQGQNGQDGITPELKIENGLLYVTYDNGVTWTEIGSVTGPQGVQGEQGTPGQNGVDGREVEFNVTPTHIQWRYVGETTYKDLISLDSLSGKDGTNGSNGTDGLSAYEIAVKLGFEGNELAWLDSLRGQDGNDGLSAYEIYLKYHPEYNGSEEEWIKDLVNGTLKEEDSSDYTDGLVFVEVSNLGYAVYDYLGYSSNIIIPEIYKGQKVIAITAWSFDDKYINSITIPNTIRIISKNAFENSTVKAIYYNGDNEKLNNISIEDGNDGLYEALTYNSESESLCLHKYEWCGGYNATCETDGLSNSYVCEKCHYVLHEGQVIEAYGHNIYKCTEQEPTCTNVGYKAYEYCTRCDYTTYEEIPALGHDMVCYDKVDNTCVYEGHEYYVCNNGCGTYEYITLEAAGHTEVIDEAIEPTCSSFGITEGKHCEVCNEVLIKQEQILMNLHTFEDESCVNCGCEYFTQDLEYKIKDNNGEMYVAVVGNGDNISSDIIIPNYYRGIPVTVIEKIHSRITSVSFIERSNIETIDYMAFERCEYLKELVLPNSIKYIKSNAFWYAEGLEKITLPENLQSIGVSAFVGCENLEYIKLPDSLKKIEMQIFMQCKNLSKVEFASDITEIGSMTFSECKSLEYIIIPATVDKIGANAFNDCSIIIYCELEKAAFNWDASWNNENHPVYWKGEWHVDENGVPSPHTYVIDEAVEPTCTETGLTEGKHCSVCNEVLIAQEVVAALGHTEVVDEAVEPTCTKTGLTEGTHCSVCNEVLVAQEVVAALGHTEVIDEAVAATCTETGLTEGKHCSACGEVLVAQEVVAALGHDLTYHEGKAATCIEAGYNAYETCSRCEHTTYEELEVIGHEFSNDICSICGEELFTDGLEYELKTNYYVVKGIGTANADTIIIPRNYKGLEVKGIAGAFKKNNELVSIKLPNSITSISDNAFSSCNSLTNVYYRGTIEDWCNISFDYSSNPMEYAEHFYMLDSNNEYYEVTTIEIPDTVTSINTHQFIGFDYVTSIVISNSVEYIGNSAFEDNINLEYIEIPGSVKEIDFDAFRDCINIKNIKFNEGLKIIRQYAFSNSESLEEAILPEGIETIEYGAFEASSIKKIYIPNSVVSVEFGLLHWCDKLESITLPDLPVKNYTEKCLGYLFGAPLLNTHDDYVPQTLKQVKLTNVAKIDSTTFANCVNLETLVITSDQITIKSKSFTTCSKLTIYCEIDSAMDSWDWDWNYSGRPVYWSGQWEYDSNGNPVPLN